MIIEAVWCRSTPSTRAVNCRPSSSYPWMVHPGDMGWILGRVYRMSRACDEIAKKSRKQVNLL
jgi:hypothetical protein